MKAFVEIHVPGCGAARHALEMGKTTVGVGPDASIRLAEAASLSAEQVELTLSEAGVRVRVPDGTPGKFIFQGSAERQASTPFGGEVFLGNVRLTFVNASETRKASPLLLLLVPAVLIFAGLGVTDEGANNVAKSEVEAPAILQTSEPVSCPVREPTAAARLARDSDHAAEAKQQRSSFELSDGVDAVQRWREAEACFQLAGKIDEAARISKQLNDWTSRLDMQYATLRLQLRGALDANRNREALSAVRSLQSLLAKNRPGAYQQWLGRLQGSLKRKILAEES